MDTRGQGREGGGGAGGKRSDWSAIPGPLFTGSFPILSSNFSLAVPCPGSPLCPQILQVGLGDYPFTPSTSFHQHALQCIDLPTMLWPLVHLGIPWPWHSLVKNCCLDGRTNRGANKEAVPVGASLTLKCWGHGRWPRASVECTRKSHGEKLLHW